jgi:hypothetical protein
MDERHLELGCRVVGLSGCRVVGLIFLNFDFIGGLEKYFNNNSNAFI